MAQRRGGEDERALAEEKSRVLWRFLMLSESYRA
jgi:hypothetical protein